MWTCEVHTVKAGYYTVLWVQWLAGCGVRLDTCDFCDSCGGATACDTTETEGRAAVGVLTWTRKQQYSGGVNGDDVTRHSNGKKVKPPFVFLASVLCCHARTHACPVPSHP